MIKEGNINDFELKSSYYLHNILKDDNFKDPLAEYDRLFYSIRFFII